jgi:SAM-dependent methyltransferase
MRSLLAYAYKLLGRRRGPTTTLPPQGEQGILQLGHRDYVGGLWDEVGQLQLDFLTSEGLTPDSVLLDIGCGALRLGSKAIEYLNSGNYLGIEKEASLVIAGLDIELSEYARATKNPTIIASDCFEFEKIGRCADIAIAQSLFTHLPKTEIRKCLKNLWPFLRAGGKLYATFFECARPRKNPTAAHDHDFFAYTKDEITSLCKDLSFSARYLGNWGHPRGQVMVEFQRIP